MALMVAKKQLQSPFFLLVMTPHPPPRNRFNEHFMEKAYPHEPRVLLQAHLRPLWEGERLEGRHTHPLLLETQNTFANSAISIR